jgi:hypothetical protein
MIREDQSFVRLINIEEKGNMLFLALIIFGQLMAMRSYLLLALTYMQQLMHTLVALCGYILEFKVESLFLLYDSFCLLFLEKGYISSIYRTI